MNDDLSSSDYETGDEHNRSLDKSLMSKFTLPSTMNKSALTRTFMDTSQTKDEDDDQFEELKFREVQMHKGRPVVIPSTLSKK